MAEEELVPRDDVRAALEARRELGPAYEAELVERFAQRIEERVEARLADRRPPAQGLTNDQRTGIAIVSMVLSIPLIAITSDQGGAIGVALVCLALVLVNVVARR